MDGNYADLSVLMSVYYKEKPEYLHEAIDSILNQTVKAKEIVLIKDGPLTKELDEVIDEYVSQYGEMFSIFALKENMGLGKALAVGVEKCKFELIARMDTDDICRNDRFEKQLAEFETYPRLDIVGTQIIEFEGCITNEISRRILPTEQLEIYKWARRRNPFNHMTVMFKKNSVISVGNYQLKGNEDYYLWCRMLVAGCKAKNINECLVYARAGKEMMLRRGGLNYIKIAIKARKLILKCGMANYLDYIIACSGIILMGVVSTNLKAWLYCKYLRS